MLGYKNNTVTGAYITKGIKSRGPPALQSSRSERLQLQADTSLMRSVTGGNLLTFATTVACVNNAVCMQLGEAHVAEHSSCSKVEELNGVLVLLGQFSPSCDGFCSSSLPLHVGDVLVGVPVVEVEVADRLKVGFISRKIPELHHLPRKLSNLHHQTFLQNESGRLHQGHGSP